MTDDPIPLDLHRETEAQKATEIRRGFCDVKMHETALRHRRETQESLMIAPASTWQEAGEKVRYLIGLFAATPAGRNPRRLKLIASVLGDLERLSQSKPPV
jgi:hypothetical protein